MVTIAVCDASDASVCDASLCDASLCDASVCDASVCDASVCDASVHNAYVHNARVHNARVHNARVHNARVHNATACWSHGLSAQRARRTKSSRPEGPKAGPKGRRLEVGARRAPRLLVYIYGLWWKISVFAPPAICIPHS